MTLTYVLSLSLVALLSVVVHLMLDRVIQAQSQSATLVNVSGQQRMLSQRSSLYALEFLYTGESVAREQAQKALEKMQRNHQLLLQAHWTAVSAGQPSPLSQTLQSMYFSPPLEVDAKIALYQQLMKNVLALDTASARRALRQQTPAFLALARHDLLDSLDRIVAQYELESMQRVSYLRRAQGLVLGVIILTLAAEALFIFRPMVTRISQLARRLREDANQDVLSGALNRRGLTMIAESVIASCQRQPRPLCLILVDIDHFKQVNDCYGHAVGDKVIAALGRQLKNACRREDYVVRMGGEEFVVLLPGISPSNALLLAEALRQSVEQGLNVHSDGQALAITISAGVAEYNAPEKDLEEALARADNALYQAKREGRNRVCYG